MWAEIYCIWKVFPFLSPTHSVVILVMGYGENKPVANVERELLVFLSPREKKQED